MPCRLLQSADNHPDRRQITSGVPSHPGEHGGRRAEQPEQQQHTQHRARAAHLLLDRRLVERRAARVVGLGFARLARLRRGGEARGGALGCRRRLLPREVRSGGGARERAGSGGSESARAARAGSGARRTTPACIPQIDSALACSAATVRSASAGLHSQSSVRNSLSPASLRPSARKRPSSWTADGVLAICGRGIRSLIFLESRPTPTTPSPGTRPLTSLAVESGERAKLSATVVVLPSAPRTGVVGGGSSVQKLADFPARASATMLANLRAAARVAAMGDGGAARAEPRGPIAGSEAAARALWEYVPLGQPLGEELLVAIEQHEEAHQLLWAAHARLRELRHALLAAPGDDARHQLAVGERLAQELALDLGAFLHVPDGPARHLLSL